MTNLAALEAPVRMSSRSEALLASLVGRFARFNAAQGRVFLNSCFDAQGVVIEHFSELTKPRQQTFFYLGALVGREKHRRSWPIRELIVLPRLPVGLLKEWYEWKGEQQAYMRRGGTEVITSSGGLKKLARIEIYSECLPFDAGTDDESLMVHVEADCRICFTYDDGEAIAFETGMVGNMPLLVTGGEERPFGLPFDTLKSRIVLPKDHAAIPTSTGH